MNILKTEEKRKIITDIKKEKENDLKIRYNKILTTRGK